jgi:hypothetical protein
MAETLEKRSSPKKKPATPKKTVQSTLPFASPKEKEKPNQEKSTDPPGLILEFQNLFYS